jgi:hypothetical protein
MGKCKLNIIKLLIVLISFLFIGGGRSVMFIADNLQSIVNQDHVSDIELPHQHQSVNFIEEDKWLSSSAFDFSCFNNSPEKHYSYMNSCTKEYSDSIWQPPKFV